MPVRIEMDRKPLENPARTGGITAENGSPDFILFTGSSSIWGTPQPDIGVSLTEYPF